MAPLAPLAALAFLVVVAVVVEDLYVSHVEMLGRPAPQGKKAASPLKSVSIRVVVLLDDRRACRLVGECERATSRASPQSPDSLVSRLRRWPMSTRSRAHARFIRGCDDGCHGCHRHDDRVFVLNTLTLTGELGGEPLQLRGLNL